MLAADAELEIFARRTAALGGDADQFADAVDIDGNKGIARDQALGEILAQEAAGIVARNAQRGLGQIVGAEGKKFARFRRFPPARSAARGSSIMVPIR